MLALVHDFPFRSTAGELELALELTGLLVEATAERPGVLPVYVSLTSGDPSPEIVEAADGAGGLPVLRGTFAAFAAVARLAWWEGRRARRLADGPVRPEWPALAVDVPRYGRDPDTLGIPTSDLQAEALAPAPEPVDGAERAALAIPERESLELLRAAGIAVVAAVPAATADSAATAAAGLGWPVVVKLDALDVAHKSDIGGVVVGIARRGRGPGGVRVRHRGWSAGRSERARRARRGAGARRGRARRRCPTRSALRPAGRGRPRWHAGRGARRRRRSGLAPITLDEARSMLADLRGAAVLGGVRGRAAADVEASPRSSWALGSRSSTIPSGWRWRATRSSSAHRGRWSVDALVVLRDLAAGGLRR